MNTAVQINFGHLIRLFNAGHIGVAAAEQLAQDGYRLELDKTCKVTKIIKDEGDEKL